MSKLFKFMAKAGLITAIVVFLVLAVAITAFAESGGYQCITGDVPKIKTENSPTLVTPLTITKLVVKAGQGCIEVYPTVDACYKVDHSFDPSSGNHTWRVSKVGDGPDCQDISHLEATVGGTEKCVITNTVYGEWSEWHWNDIYWERHRTYTVYDQDGETVCSRGQESEYEYPGLNSRSDCKGWSVYETNPREREKLIDQGLWKDLTTNESFWYPNIESEVRVFVREPQDCDECVSKRVFYWDDGLCKIRQRGGPIGGQTRPFVPMIYSYCGCGYVWGDWVGRYADSCEGGGSEYTYWNELPQFCGYQTCE